MIKKINLIVTFCFLFIILPVHTFAQSLEAGEYYPPSDSDYYKKKISWKLYFDYNTTKVIIRQYDLNQVLLNQQDMTVTPNSFLWIDMKCQGPTSFEFIDKTGTSEGFQTRGEDRTGIYLDDSNCGPPSLSDYNEAQKQYASDTFGATKSPLSDPPTADGSGGGSSSSGGSTDCAACQIFKAPEWNDYMGKVDAIKNAIPPPPNWDQVAGTFRDTIVPQIISDLSGLLGTAPAAPAVPEQPSGTDDRGINDSAPSMNDVPGLGDSSSNFNAGSIKDSAPVIQENPDPTGGFSNLVQDPVASLPGFPTDALPKPGSTNAGDWGQNKPAQPDNPFPSKPADTGTPDTGSAPKPADSGATPPAPGDSSGTAPKPSDSGSTPPTPGGTGGTAPSPSGDTYPGMKDYKPTPDSPDGSGGDFSP